MTLLCHFNPFNALGVHSRPWLLLRQRTRRSRFRHVPTMFQRLSWSNFLFAGFLNTWWRGKIFYISYYTIFLYICVSAPSFFRSLQIGAVLLLNISQGLCLKPADWIPLVHRAHQTSTEVASNHYHIEFHCQEYMQDKELMQKATTFSPGFHDGCTNPLATLVQDMMSMNLRSHWSS